MRFAFNFIPYLLDVKIKFHKGFLERSEKVAKAVREKILKKKEEEHKTNFKVILTGHSLGAAVASVVHILLADDKILHNVEIETITFAVPMFGNVTLWETLRDDKEKSAKMKMYHFVYDADIVPALLLEKQVYKQLRDVIQSIDGDKSFWRLRLHSGLHAALTWNLTGDQRKWRQKIEEEFKQKLSKFEEQFQKSAQDGQDSPILDKNDHDSYWPIGTYLHMMKDNDHAWPKPEDVKDQFGSSRESTANQLNKSLEILKKVEKLPNAELTTDAAKGIWHYIVDRLESIWQTFGGGPFSWRATGTTPPEPFPSILKHHEIENYVKYLKASDPNTKN